MLQIADLSCGFVLLRLGRKLTDSSQIMLCNHVKLCIIDGYGVEAKGPLVDRCGRKYHIIILVYITAHGLLISP
jgi:hypothetical protein